jgi:hypothetical protein
MLWHSRIPLTEQTKPQEPIKQARTMIRVIPNRELPISKSAAQDSLLKIAACSSFNLCWFSMTVSAPNRYLDVAVVLLQLGIVVFLS